MKRYLTAIITVLISLNAIAKTGQDGPPTRSINVDTIPNATPVALKKSKLGNPPFYRALGKTYHVLATAKGYEQIGIASWYGTQFHQKKTSSGELYNMYAMTAASPVLPIPCFVKVTNLENKKSVIVKVNDRGPFHPGRIIDLSYVAAKKLGIVKKGTGRVRVVAITHQADQPLTKPAHTAIYLQLGIFRDNKHVVRLQQQIKQLFPALPIDLSKAEQLITVRLGPFASFKQSDPIKASLQTIGIKAYTQIVRQ